MSGARLSFGAATAVSRVPGASDTFTCHLPPTWSTPGGVHGGVLVAAALRAALVAVERPDLRLRTAHAVFLAPPSNDVTFAVEVLREGGGSAHLRTRGTCDTSVSPVVDVTVVLTSDRDSSRFCDAVQPEVPGWDEVGPVAGSGAGRGHGADAPIPVPPLFDNLEIRPVLGMPPWSPGWRPGQPARHLRWSRYVEHPGFVEDPSGTRSVDPLALLPPADLPGSAVWARLGPGDPVTFFLSLDMSVTFLEPVRDETLLADVQARWMGDGHVYVETDLWSAGRLVATSAQAMVARRG